MAHVGNREKTFGQKVKSFLGKVSLAAAFAGAAGVGYHHHYRTQEDVTAKVSSVEHTPKGTIIHTDKGVFSNHKTAFHQKDEKKAQEISAKIAPGGTYKFNVYGIFPRIGSLSPDTFGIHRNIANAVPVSLPPPPRPAPQAGDTCAKNSNLVQMAEVNPQLAQDIEIMKWLPLTGSLLYDFLKDPENAIESCVFQVARGKATVSTYLEKRARIASTGGTSIAFHEYFHAAQDLRADHISLKHLTLEDAAALYLMKEAAAVAYEMVSKREAENLGMTFSEPGNYTVKIEAETINYSAIKASTNAGSVKAFNLAYDAALLQNTQDDEKTRMQKALSAGGQAVVRHLLAAQDTWWNNHYIELTQKHVNPKAHIFKKSRDIPEYDDKRNTLYAMQGFVSHDISLVPPEFLGPDADAEIAKTLKAFGLSVVRTPQKRTKTKQPRIS